MKTRAGSGTKVTLRELTAVTACAFVATVLMTWPLITQMTDILPGMGAIGDPYLNTWQIAWQAHALGTDPSGYLQANTLWPYEDSLAFIDTTAGYAAAGFVGDGLDAAVARYNSLFLFTYALAFVATFLLARQLGLGVAGAIVAGAAFAFAPWRVAQNGHIVVLSSGGIPLTLYFLLRAYARRRPLMIIAGGAVAAWQLSVGFTLGLQFVYLLAGLACLFVIRAWRGREPDLSKRFVLSIGVAAAILLIVGIALAIPFLRIAAAYPAATNRFNELNLYSPPPSGFLTAPEYNWVWGDITEGLRDGLRWPEEQTLFPGLAVIALATIGVLSRPFSRNVRIGLVIIGGCALVLSMGVAWGPSRMLYSFLYEVAPGWRAVRTPGRLNTTTSLALALLAGAGAMTLVRRVRQSSRASRVKPALAACALLLVVLVEGRGSLWSASPRPYPAGLSAAEPPTVHLPFDEIHDRIYTYWSINGFPEIVNGVGAVVPLDLRRLRVSMKDFPDLATIDELRDLGVKTVVLHPDLAAGTPWRDTAEAETDGLGITRSEVGDVILFDLDPPNLLGRR